MKKQFLNLISVILSAAFVLCSVSAAPLYAAPGTVKPTTATNSSLETKAKQSKKYTDFPNVIDFGALTDTAVTQIQYDYGDNCHAIYYYSTVKVSSKDVSQYTDLLVASGFVDSDTTEIDGKDGIYHHIFKNDTDEYNTTVSVLYGQKDALVFKGENSIIITISQPKDKFPQVLKSVTAKKSNHEPDVYTKYRSVPDYGSYMGTQLVGISNVSDSSLGITGTGYVYSGKSAKNGLSKYLSLCIKNGYYCKETYDPIGFNLIPKNLKKNPYSISIAPTDEGVLVIVYKGTY